MTQDIDLMKEAKIQKREREKESEKVGRSKLASTGKKNSGKANLNNARCRKRDKRNEKEERCL